MYELNEYREIVLKILQFPGLRHQFRAQGLEIFLRGHTIEVRPHKIHVLQKISCVYAANMDLANVIFSSIVVFWKKYLNIGMI